ncbi:hypothetical protein GCM10010862_12000 [Devosia nitrariae]|uniref:Uncharacterized protein n=1 Tax=Devosia nitrariae TaxID=2071872 RepID=A0ABQ5W2L1_9HYPH|nr:hypothetical protein GCM10010862_12000 [Devosia nitrariae]
MLSEREGGQAMCDSPALSRGEKALVEKLSKGDAEPFNVMSDDDGQGRRGVKDVRGGPRFPRPRFVNV